MKKMKETVPGTIFTNDPSTPTSTMKMVPGTVS
jgi:hypothetical protein